MAILLHLISQVIVERVVVSDCMEGHYMPKHEEYELFVEHWGGRTRFYDLVATCLNAGSGAFAEALSMLVQSNAFAKSRVSEILRIVTANGELGKDIQIAFQGTPETHGVSTDDDFFKAKSERFLLNAELQHSLDENALNNEEGWPDADKDIGEA